MSYVEYHARITLVEEVDPHNMLSAANLFIEKLKRGCHR